MVVLGIFDRLKENGFFCVFDISLKSISGVLTVNSTFNIYIYILEVFVCLQSILFGVSHDVCSTQGRQEKSLKSTCYVNLLSKLSIIFKEWRVIVLFVL